MSAALPPIFFTQSRLDRATHLRDRPEQLAQWLREKKACYLPVFKGRHLYTAPEKRLWVAEQPIADTTPCFLGVLADTLWFACPLNETQAARLQKDTGYAFSSLRRSALALDTEQAHIAMYSRGLDLWQRSRKFCPRCGTPNRVHSAGHRLLCQQGHEQFPHIEPAIIALISKGDRCLLSRKANWPPNVYSTLAGFVEPGETIEEAVKREMLEEANIHVTDITYQGSQPWPFPASLMLAFTATAVNEDIRLADEELEDAQWFQREELRQAIERGLVAIPPRFTVSHHLIQGFLARA
jgi:NAD+ diphosphatase